MLFTIVCVTAPIVRFQFLKSFVCRYFSETIVFDRVGQIEEIKNDSAILMLLQFFFTDVSEEEAQTSNRYKRKVSFYTHPLSKRMKDTGISHFLYQYSSMGIQFSRASLNGALTQHKKKTLKFLN